MTGIIFTAVTFLGCCALARLLVFWDRPARSGRSGVPRRTPLRASRLGRHLIGILSGRAAPGRRSVGIRADPVSNSSPRATGCET
jgi:hypothetical protein